jgi:ABC-type Co2+ transport system permease subunit
MGMMQPTLLWAVHLSDGVLSWPWLLGGFVLSGVLCLVAAWGIRDEEIPRIAVLTAAFFVASSIHVKLGPTSQHLLLNGLVGVVLGWRAPLAILLGVGLQALLVPHGGLTTIGINACTQTLPALAGAGLFRLFHGQLDISRSVVHWMLLACSALLWGGCLWLGLAVLLTHPWHGLFHLSMQSGLVLSLDNLAPTWQLATQPLALGLLALFVAGSVLWLHRAGVNGAFSLGLLLGVFAVLSTVTLASGVLVLGGGAEQWGVFVNAIFLAHLPLALLEGLILGVTVSFLARVKPEIFSVTRAMPRGRLEGATPAANADRLASEPACVSGWR